MTADASLCARLARRDESALSELYDRLAGRVYGLAVSILRDAGEAEEVVADAFLQVWRGAGSFDPARGSLDAWLIMIARSRALDRRRARARRRDIREGAEREIASFTLSDPPPDPEERAISTTDMARRVRPALRDLPDAQRQVIELAYLGGLTQSEIAARLEVPLGTVKTRMRTGMQELRDALTGTPEGGGA